MVENSQKNRMAFQKIKFFSAWVAMFAGVLFSYGCAAPSRPYQVSIDNVQLFKNATQEKLNVGTVGIDEKMAGGKSVAMRANSMTSNVGEHFGDYLKDALKQELQLAGLYEPAASVQITGTLLRNNIDAGGLATNSGQIEARFIVKRKEDVKFDKVKSAQHSWPSEFAAMVAIPLAINNYTVLVQKLISELAKDPDFVRSLKN
jgi:hypothetical protein